MKILSVVLLILNYANCAKILGVFPIPSISHQIVYRELMKDLADRGHELIILTPNVYETDNPNVTQIDWRSSYKIFQKEFNFVDYKNSDMDDTDFVNFFIEVVLKYNEEQLNHPDVKKLIKERHNHHFDVIIVEVFLDLPMLAFGELFDAPIIEFTSLDTVNENHERMGNGANPVLHPEFVFPFQQTRPNFNERWQSLKYLVKRQFAKSSQEAKIKRLIRNFFPNVDPDLDKLSKRVEFMMVNTHPALGYVRPLVPNTIQLGFMHIKPPKPLEEGALKNFLDNSKNGVIYMSLGSNVQSKDLGPEVQKLILNVFGNIKYDVLWKFESDYLPNKPKNVMIQKWLPQADLLAHPKIKLFITQGGQQSMEEAIDRTIPTIVIPFLADQDANAKRLERKNVGKHLELHTLTEEKFKSAIEEMLKPKYKRNMRFLRNLVYDQPMTSREKAVWWTEYVIRNKGAKHLVYAGNTVPFHEKYFLDFALIGFLILAATCMVNYFVLTKLFALSQNLKPKIELLMLKKIN